MTTATNGRTRAGVTSAIGVPGLSLWRGFIREEEQPQLKDRTKRLKIFREMRRDTLIGALEYAIIMPLLAADFDVIPAGESRADQDAADFIWKTLGLGRKTTHQSLFGDMDTTWVQHVEDMLEMIPFGFSLGEIVLKRREDGLLGLADITPIGQETLDVGQAWTLDEMQNVEAIRQRDPVGGRMIDIPGWKLLHFTLRSRKRNPEGESLFANLWRDWHFRVNFEELEGIGVERDVGGMPIVYPPEQLTEGEKNDVRDHVGGMKQDEEAVLIMPGPKAGMTDDKRGWLVEAYGSHAKAYNIREVIRDYDVRILMRFLATFLKLGTGDVGSFALVKGQQDFFSLPLIAIQQKMLAEWQRSLISLLMHFNADRFGGISGNPVLTWAMPGKEDLEGLRGLYTDLKNAGVLTITELDEDHVRAVAGLPDRPEGVGEGDRTPQPVPFPPFPGGQPQPEEFRRYQEPAAGQDLRPRRDRLTTATNGYQRELVSAYDSWAVRAMRAVRNARRDGLAPTQQVAIVDAMLSDLEFDLRNLGRTKLMDAARLHLSGPLARHRDSPAVIAMIGQRIAQNDLIVGQSLMPDIRQRIASDILAGVADDDQALRGAFEARRARVGSYAGGYWAMAFDAQKVAGVSENAERRALGLEPIAVRWELDPTAQHCDDSPGFFGCPSLARVYEGGWESMPTVPAGQVTCMGNCRCGVSMRDPETGQWERIT